jgi:hypothetical protein
MKIKHSKYKNTGLIFELLVKQIAADTLSRTESPAIKILKKHYTGQSALVREFKLYEFILKNKGVSQTKAETILTTIAEMSRKIDRTALKNQKYGLIKELKEAYDLDEFFSIKVRDYKSLAALYCLMEAQNAEGLVDPQVMVDNKTTLLEHLTDAEQSKADVKDTIVEEFSKYDKDLRLLTYKILLEKFNGAYDNFLPEQKNILKEFITAVSSTNKLRTIVNEELEKIADDLSNLTRTVSDNVVAIKVAEVAKGVKLLEKTEKVNDDHLVTLMQYYELINELRNA